MSMRKFVPRERYVELYHSEGLSLAEIAKLVGKSVAGVWKDMDRFAIGRRSQIHHVGLDRSWFDAIDSDDKAYAFGFICADGSLVKTGKRICITIQERDRKLLEDLCAAAGGGHIRIHKGEHRRVLRGREYTCRATVSLLWDSRQMVEALKRHGLCYNKAKVLPRITPPPAEHMRAFVRGLIDGDGCLCTHTNGTMSVGFTNHNESLLEIVAGYFFRITGAVPKILRYSKRNGSPVKMVTVSGPRAAAVACDLYLTPPARMALGRKCQKAKEIVAITNVKRYKKEKLPTPW